MLARKGFALCAFGLIMGQCSPVEAQVKCGKSEDVEAFLKRDFNEVAMIEASHESGATLQFFVSPDMKTGTIIMKRPDGISCFVADVTDIAPAAKPIILPATKNPKMEV
jgi:hypothetical protein